ncbi:hypothetical protein [Agromyces lapidis]|uniref:Uncharacterized protein n=1 Tax=Agromyces lapidis TaxID=279574 RepID=A0ABV5SSH3_9MICO|nr:hypothetical protein [Agromyces lapidis]
MKLQELRDIITNTTPADWELVTHGPYYHDAFSTVSGGGGGLRIEEARSHGSKVVLRDDIDISIEWGFTWDDARDRGELWWPWAKSFPDPNAYTFWVDIFYRGALVDRNTLVSVDGGRAYLPVADAVRIDGGSPMEPAESTDAYDFYVDEWDYGLARTVDGFGHNEFDSYFARAGLKRHRDR